MLCGTTLSSVNEITAAAAAMSPQDLAKALREAIKGAASEEDLRVEVEVVFRQALPDLPKAKYEASIKTSSFAGRADAVHQGVIVEYKKPRRLRSAAERTETISQLSGYLETVALGEDAETGSDSGYSQKQEERLAGFVGVATDGERWLFIQRRGRSWAVDEEKLDADTAERILLWLRAMRRKDLSPENLLADFGPHTELAAEVVGEFARLVHSKKYPKANVVFDEWERIFGIVYGTDQLSRSRSAPEAKALTAAYQLDIGVEFPELLFAVHTYYALLMKLLATEVIVAQGSLGDTFVGNLSNAGLPKQLSDLEAGAVLRRYNIRNAIEQDFFGWYPEAWTKSLHKVLWKFCKVLSGYDIATFQIQPDRARDLLKDLYHGLIPESVRHALGEYYTPDWLAEHTVDLSGFDGDPRKTLLDPACGSGTFLVIAIQRVRQWLADHAVEWNTNEKKLEAVDLIRHNIVGFDLNPLAVIASRTNYLFALGPFLRYRRSGAEFEIPVYLTDSVLLPGKVEVQADLFSPDTLPFRMTVGTFHLPQEVVHKRLVPDLMNLLHDAIAQEHDCEAFVTQATKRLGLSCSDKVAVALESLFAAMKDLDDQGKNRIWAKLIRNRYAALFFHEYFDFVVGNPPHVNWESLTPEWRKAAEGEYQRYGLFTLSGLESRHGGGKKDIAALFTYAVLDHFLKEKGVLALVVHVSLFKTTGAGEGYRRFQLGNDEHFAIREVHDFRRFQPFQTHSKMKIKTRTATFSAEKGAKTKYPVPYTVWEKVGRGFIPGSLTLEEASERLSPTKIVATPLRGRRGDARLSPWLTVPKGKLAQCNKLIAPEDYDPAYRGYAGFNTGGLNGGFFLNILEEHPDGSLTVENRSDVGKKACPKVRATIEPNLVYPLLRGRSVRRWGCTTEGHVLLVQDPKTRKGYDEKWMQATLPLTWAYLRNFEDLLRERAAFKKFYEPTDPFYSMYNIGPYSFASHRVIWMDVSEVMKAAVIPWADGNPAMPEHKLMVMPTNSLDEAHYVTAVLNSPPFNLVVTGYAVDNSISTHPIRNIRIPKFDAKDATHQDLVRLSKAAHAAEARGEQKAVAKAERGVAKAVKALWS